MIHITPDKEAIERRAPKGIHRNHVDLSGVPVFLLGAEEGHAFNLYYVAPDGAVNNIYVACVDSDPALGDVIQSAGWAIVKGRLIQSQEGITMIVAEDIHFNDDAPEKPRQED